MDWTLIYYRRKDTGEITQHHPVPDDWTPEITKERIGQYNSEEGHKTTAHTITAETGSFEAYLLDRLEKKYRIAKEAIQEALDAIEEAKNCVNSLEVEP